MSERMLTEGQADLLSCLRTGTVVTRDKLPPHGWRYLDRRTREPIPSDVIDGLLESGLVEMRPVAMKWESHMLVAQSRP
jgi:hypothetical protein